MRWERIGATPQMLRNVCDPEFCRTSPCQTTAQGTQCFINAPGNLGEASVQTTANPCIDFNFDRDAGCSSYDHRTVLYTVTHTHTHTQHFPQSLVLHPLCLLFAKGLVNG